MLPGLLSYGDHVTIRQLLNHTGGVPDYAATVSGTLDRFGQGRFRAWTPQELVAPGGRPATELPASPASRT
jgi:D-alanyl-D-alanine carboxypeptidase